MALNYLQGMAGRFGRGANTLGTMEDPRARFAQQLQAESVDTSPAFLGTGLSRLGKALVGALLMKRSMADQEAATKWLASKMPDRTRPPTEAEAFEASPELDVLRQQQLVTPVFEAKLAPDTDDVLMQGIPTQYSKTEVDIFEDPVVTREGIDIPKTLEQLNFLNYMQEQHKDFPEQTEFTYPATGETDTATAETFAKLPGAIDEKSRLFAEQMEQARQESMRYRPRDYAQELATGMEAYRADPMHQISDPYTRMEWLRESAQGLEGNPFVSRMLQNLMFADIGREEEDRKYRRELEDRRKDTKLASDIQESQFEQTIGLNKDKMEAAGWKLDNLDAGGGMTQRAWINRDGRTIPIGKPYDSKLMSAEAVKQQTEIYTGKRESLAGITSPLQKKQIAKLEREEKEAEQEIKNIKLKDRSALQDFKRKTETLAQTIANAESMINTFSTGAIGGVAQYMPWPTDRSRLDDYLTTLKANLGFDSLQKMRDNSKTGGALGQVSEMENKLLQAINGALNPKNPGVMKANLDRIKLLYPQVLAEKMQTYKDTYNEPYDIGSGALNEVEKNRLQELRRKRDQ